MKINSEQITDADYPPPTFPDESKMTYGQRLLRYGANDFFFEEIGRIIGSTPRWALQPVLEYLREAEHHSQTGDWEREHDALCELGRSLHSLIKAYVSDRERLDAQRENWLRRQA